MPSWPHWEVTGSFYSTPGRAILYISFADWRREDNIGPWHLKGFLSKCWTHISCNSYQSLFPSLSFQPLSLCVSLFHSLFVRLCLHSLISTEYLFLTHPPISQYARAKTFPPTFHLIWSLTPPSLTLMASPSKHLLLYLWACSRSPFQINCWLVELLACPPSLPLQILPNRPH